MSEKYNVLITAGPTREPIDPVRFISNRSSGKMGYALARSFLQNIYQVSLISGPVCLEPPEGVKNFYPVETAFEMYEMCMKHAPASDIIIMAAAVADYSPVQFFDKKVKKSLENWHLELKKTKDILAELGKMKKKHQFLVGFSLETHDELDYARQKLMSKNLDAIVMNSLQDPGAGFEFDTNKITIISRDGEIIPLPLKSKEALADDIRIFIENKLGIHKTK